MFRKEKLQLKKRKNAALKVLLLSVFVTFMCFSMLVGTTYAWLTDSVTSGRNRILSGTLDIQMFYYDGTDFVSAEGDVFENVTWQPGAETHRLIQIYNNSDMPVKIAFKANVMTEYGSINTQDVSFLLSDSLVSHQAAFEDKTTALSALSNVVTACQTSGEAGFRAFTVVYADTPTGSDAIIAPEGSRYVLLAMYMPESGVENSTVKDGMPLPTFDIELDLTAVQASGAQDSFGYVPGVATVPTSSVDKAKDTYRLETDKLLYEKEDANNNKYYEINDAADFARFAAAVNKGTANGGSDFAGETVMLMADIELGDTVTWPLTGVFNGTFNGNGKTISKFKFTVNETDGNQAHYATLFNGTNTVNGLTVTDIHLTRHNTDHDTDTNVHITSTKTVMSNGTIDIV